MIEISAEQRRALRARAHSLQPTVAIATHGLSDAVLREIETSLKAHELIKIRVFSDEREVREGYLAKICAELDAAPVQHIGKLLVVWRPAPVDTARQPATHADRGARRTKRSMQGSSRK